MSYDLSFRGRSKPLSRSALRDWFADREHYAFPDEDAEVVAYDDDVTGVYFHFRFTEDEEGPRLAFEINAFRPQVGPRGGSPRGHGVAGSYALRNRSITRRVRRHARGRYPLTAASDRFTEHKWTEVGVDENSLWAIAVGDMEVVDLGEPIKATGDCVRD